MTRQNNNNNNNNKTKQKKTRKKQEVTRSQEARRVISSFSCGLGTIKKIPMSWQGTGHEQEKQKYAHTPRAKTREMNNILQITGCKLDACMHMHILNHIKLI